MLDFPGGPVVKNPPRQCGMGVVGWGWDGGGRGMSSLSIPGRFHMAWSS